MPFCVLRRGGPGVVPRWSRGGPGVVWNPHWAIPICKKCSSHSNIEHYTTNRSFTKTTLRIIKRAGAAPQQCCKSQNEQELHHSNITNYKTSRSFTTAMLQSTKRAGASAQQHCEFQTNQTQKICLSHSQLCHWLFPRRKPMVCTHSQFVQNGV